jgi:hypothetical protein
MHPESLEPLDLGDWFLALWGLAALVLTGVRFVLGTRRQRA